VWEGIKKEDEKQGNYKLVPIFVENPLGMNRCVILDIGDFYRERFFL